MIILKSLTVPKNVEGDPLGFSNIHSVAKHQKIEGRKKFLCSKKNLTLPKKLKGGPFEIFQHPFCWKTAKKSKSRSAEKN